MLPPQVVLEICGVYVLHVKPTLVALAANPLLAPLRAELVAGVLLMHAARVGLLPLGVLGDWLLVTVTRVRLGWPLGRAAGGRD